MRLIVGLGNPGRQYVGTRHNIGWEVLDVLAEKLSLGEFNRLAKAKFEGLAMDGSLNVPGGEPQRLILLKPTTFMNASGRAVQSAMAFYQLSPAEIMVVLDDLALPAGRIRLRPGGSHGSHNGLRDIERAIGTQQYPRLRIGIDPAPPGFAGKDYVLGKFSPEQRPLVDNAVKRAADAIVTWIESGVDKAMNRFNAEEATPEK
ncbi:MAG TPA: aminoacyl-tRNA hydrolase [Tepidisphaeraceae bacterium]|jgi:PTH1 family peptidyl-tRNA hydrolase|nr:aminoacyl-tRNA hydrolase [Tepidisphaeraceae bacterium]